MTNSNAYDSTYPTDDSAGKKPDDNLTTAGLDVVNLDPKCPTQNRIGSIKHAPVA
jgi:hypothetical protein